MDESIDDEEGQQILDVDEEDNYAPLRRYYTPKEVSKHNHALDCWISWLGKVYNLTPLIAEFGVDLPQKLEDDSLIKPILAAAGTDISSWFDPLTGKVRTHRNEMTGLEVPYTPNGRFVHIPPPEPRSDFRNDFGIPWWLDSKYCIGNLSQKTRFVRIVNSLSHQEHVLEVCSEETIQEIVDRYLSHNENGHRYIWKRKGELLQMDKTLEENGIPDESAIYEKLGLDPEFYYPALHMHYQLEDVYQELSDDDD